MLTPPIRSQPSAATTDRGDSMSNWTSPGDAHADLASADGDADQVATAVLSASQLLIELSARSLSSVEDTLTLPQFRMLVILESRGELSLARLAEHLAVNPSTAFRMAERLISLGMLARGENNSNRREVLLSLTLSGRRIVTDVTIRRRTEIAEIVASIPPNQRADLLRALQTFTNSGDEPLATALSGCRGL